MSGAKPLSSAEVVMQSGGTQTELWGAVLTAFAVLLDELDDADVLSLQSVTRKLRRQGRGRPAGALCKKIADVAEAYAREQRDLRVRAILAGIAADREMTLG